MSFKVEEEEWKDKTQEFKIVIKGTGLKKYKQIKRLLDVLRMIWFK